MKIIELEATDSTSDYALRLLAEGAQLSPAPVLPLAVIARRQTLGRGRSGKTWESPLGGIYATLVLAGGSLPSGKLGMLPLLVACGVAGWIWEHFRIRATIKWPNDLLFGGAKLGGILCESSVQGQDWGPLLIGVGINVKAAPLVAEQASVSIEEILGGLTIDDIPSLSRSFVRYLEAALRSPELEERYHEFGIEAGQLWRNTDGSYASIVGLGADGHLQLDSLASATRYELSSVRHDWQWIYQVPEPLPLLLADVGNSLIKVLVTRRGESSDGAQFLRFAVQNGEIIPLDDSLLALNDLKLREGWPVHAISVNDRLLELFRQYLARLSLRLLVVPKRPLRVRFDRYRFSELGADRVALVEAAAAQWPRENLIVVSAGTAVTVEVLSKDGVYEGGYILPGLQTKLSALHERTARLPAIELKDIDAAAMLEAELLGQDTQTAMLRGVLRETAFALQGLRTELKARSSTGDWQVVCTGGDGALLSSVLQVPYRAQLILEGVAAMVRGGTLTL